MTKKTIITTVLIFVICSILTNKASALHVFPDTTYPGKKKNGQLKNINLNLAVQSGVQMGVMDEFVFEDGYKVSELNWDLMPIVYLGFNVNFNYRFFFMSLGYWGSVYNDQVGYIEDRDWNSGGGSMFQYSKHDCFLDAGHFVDLNFSFVPYRHRFFNLSLILGFNYKIVKARAVDGYLQNPPGSAKIYVTGNIIKYEQEHFIPFFGFAFSFPLPINFSIGISFYYSPFVVVDAVDNHLIRVPKMDFFDLIKFGQYIAVGFDFGYKIIDNLSINLNFQYIKLFESKGESYSYNHGTQTKSSVVEDGAGAGFEVYNISLGIKYNVFTL